MSRYQTTPGNTGSQSNTQDDEHQRQPADTTVQHAEDEFVTSAKQYTNLRKLSKRNEHTVQVRRIQNAATKIQRAWRRHRYQQC